MAKQYLDDRKVKYEEVDVSVDRDAAKWVLDKIGQIATPVIDIDGIVVIGFDRQKIDAALRE